MSGIMFIRLFYNTEGANLQAECAIGMRHRPVIGGLRRQVGIADLACQPPYGSRHRGRGGFQTRLYVPTRNGA